MMNTSGLKALRIVLCAAMTGAIPAHAQVDLVRARPPTSDRAGLVTETPELGPEGFLQLGFQHETTGLALVLRDPETGEPVMDGRVVARRHLTQIAGTLALTPRFELGAGWGAALQRGDGTRGRPAVDRFGLVDIEVRAKYGRRIGRIAVAVGARVTAPTGDTGAYLGSSGSSAALNVLAGGRLGPATWTLNTGYRTRPRQTAFDLVVDDEVEIGAAARLPRGRWWLELEASGVLGLGASTNDSPVGALAGVGVLFGAWSFHAGVGAGIADGYGAPAWEAVLAARRSPPRVAPRPRVVWEPTDDPEDSRIPPTDAVVFDNDRLILADRVLFEVDDATVRPEARPLLVQIVARWRREPTWQRLRVEGHADARGEASQNLALSQRRADAVRAALIEAGADPSRLDAIGFGERQPLVEGDDDASHRKNRRVELVVERTRVEGP